MNWPLPAELSDHIVSLTDKQALCEWIAKDPESRSDAELPEYLRSKLTPKVIMELTQDSIHELQHLPEVTLRLAYQPNRPELCELAQLLRNRLDMPVVIQAIYDPSVVAGVVLETENQAFDLTIVSRRVS